ncbi:MAG TPA: HEPN domain-containing protein [Phaeodactylibacter sp.]|nr:HEPN domain-containing protein [Phaeodactylibacter sp.]
MKQSERVEYVKYRLEKAKETLEVAELLIENEKWNSAINRLYYAAYYAVSALLVQSKINTKTHAGVKTQFFLNYIKTGKIEKHLGQTYSDLFDWRHKGDYGDFFDFTEELVRPVLKPTKELIQKVENEIDLSG